MKKTDVTKVCQSNDDNLKAKTAMIEVFMKAKIKKMTGS